MPNKKIAKAEKTQQKKSNIPRSIIPQAVLRRERFALRLLPFLFVAAALFLVVLFNYHILKNTALGEFSRSLATAIHFPVAKVDTSLISFSTIQKEQERIHTVVARLYPQSALPKQEEFRLAFAKTVRNTLMQKGYDAYGITISQEETQHGFIQLFGALPSSAEAHSLVRESTGLSVEEFINMLLSDYLLQQKFNTALLQDAKQLAKVKKEAEQLYAIAKHSPSDVTQATDSLTTVDASYQRGIILSAPDLAGVFSPVKECTPGNVLPVIETKEAFVVVICQQKITDDSSEGASYWSVDEIVVAKIASPFWLAARLADAHITLFPEGISWEKECGSAVLSGSACSKQLANGVDSAALQNLLESGSPAFPFAP